MRALPHIALLVMLGIVPFSVPAQDKVGYVNLTDILETMPEYKLATDSLQDFMNEITHHHRGLQDEYNRMTGMMERSHKVSIPEDSIEYIKQIEASMAIMETGIEIEGKREALMEPILQKITDAIRNIAAKHGYTYVFDSSNIRLLLAPEGSDITSLVKRELGLTN